MAVGRERQYIDNYAFNVGNKRRLTQAICDLNQVHTSRRREIIGYAVYRRRAGIEKLQQRPKCFTDDSGK